MKNYKLPLLALALAAGLFFFDPALAQLIDATDNPKEIGGNTAWGGSMRLAMLTVINFFLFFLGIVATAFVIYGGFLYVTSAGDDTKVEQAKKIILYAAVGIVIVLLSFALVNTVISSGQGQRTAT